jgi:hypothetical protein
MYVVVRSYSGQGASELFDLLAQREEDVKALISGCLGSPATQQFAVAMAA